MSQKIILMLEQITSVLVCINLVLETIIAFSSWITSIKILKAEVKLIESTF